MVELEEEEEEAGFYLWGKLQYFLHIILLFFIYI